MTAIEAVEALKQAKQITYTDYIICQDWQSEGRFAVLHHDYSEMMATCSSPENAIHFVWRDGTGDYETPMSEIDIEFQLV